MPIQAVVFDAYGNLSDPTTQKVAIGPQPSYTGHDLTRVLDVITP